MGSCCLCWPLVGFGVQGHSCVPRSVCCSCGISCLRFSSASLSPDAALYEILGRDMVIRAQQTEIPHCFIYEFEFFGLFLVIFCGGMLKMLVKYYPSGLFAFPAESTKKTFTLEFLPPSNLSVQGVCDLVNTSSGSSFNYCSIYLCTLNITCHDKLQARLNHFH